MIYKNQVTYFPNFFLIGIVFFFILYPLWAFVQEDMHMHPVKEKKETSKTIDSLQLPVKVDVKPKALDYEISQRLENILKSTDWFMDPYVKVKDGVVFLEGKTRTDEYKKWAGELAHNTQDTVAVVNHIHVMAPSIFDFQPIIAGLHEQWHSLLRTIPSIIFGLLILLITWVAVKSITFLVRLFLKNRLKNPLLRRVVVWGVGLGVFLTGLYTVFHLMGLTDIALTIIGGTGLLGIILGIAFKDITENLLASIFLSINNPFHSGDLIEIDGITGYVQSLTIRSTILITLEGNYVQIPNAKVYKSNIRNYTSNSNRREDFIIGIGYGCAISDAQEVALKILKEHPAILSDPEPWVLVDNLSSATVNLRIYFWLDGKKHSWLKVRSSVIRLIKRAFQLGGISMPDEGRERVFPDGIVVRMISQKTEKQEKGKPVIADAINDNEKKEIVATAAEGKLNSEAEGIKEQALKSRTPEEGSNLLKKETSGILKSS
ncbi:MAG: mechanosensitive ion channel [Parachlamydiaceae bacterium]|nr:mechanosensitive ion channel [Parachlamydiaceae bacterium]